MQKFLTLALLIFHFSLFTFHCLAQDQHQVDSLLAALKKHDAARKELGSKAPAMYDTTAANILHDLSSAYQGNNPDTAMYYANQSMAISEQIGYKKGIGNAYYIMGAINYDKGEFTTSLEFHKKALKIREEIGDKKNIATSYKGIGLDYDLLGNYPEALKNDLAALKIYEEIGNKRGVSMSYNNIGIIYHEQGNYPEALKNHFAALKIREESGNKKDIASSYDNIGSVYNNQANYPEALKNQLAGLKIREELGDKNGIANSNGNLGNINFKQGNYSEALKSYFVVLKIKEELGDKDALTAAYLNIGETYIKEKKYNDASLYLNKGLTLAKERGILDWIRNSYEFLTELDSSQGNFSKALEHYKLYITIRDSLVNTETTKKTVALQMNYDFGKKQDSLNAVQAKKDAVAAVELNKQKQQKIGIFIGFILVLMLAFVLYNRFRIKKNANIALEEKNKIITKEKERSEELLLNILPAEVAEELKETGGAKAKSFDEVTVMFTDFKGFTQISEKMTPEQLVAEIDYCFKGFDNIIHKYGIEKIKTIGDSYMCAGGLPVTNKTHAVDVVKAAIEIKDFMVNLKKEKEAKGEIPFEIRIGIHTGPVVAGIVGIKKFAYDIWGDTVNLASRMESSGEPGKVNISGSTYELIKDKFTCIHRGKIQAKNKGEVDMYFVG